MVNLKKILYRLEAYDEVIGSAPKGWRSVLKKAGGAPFLKSLDRENAEKLLNNALKEVLKENKGAEKPKDVEIPKGYITEWVDTTFGIGTGKGEEDESKDYDEEDEDESSVVFDTSKSRAKLKSAPSDREKWPKHLAAKGVIPPAWTDLKLNDDPREPIWATGKDSLGRVVQVANPAFRRYQSAKKYQKLKDFQNSKSQMYDQVKSDLESSDATIRDNASIVRLMRETGLRPGTVEPDKQKQVKGKKPVYGAVTLEGRHVSIDKNGTVWLKFIGKKNVPISIPIEDEETAIDLLNRKEMSEDSGKLFADTNYNNVNNYWNSLEGNKGFRLYSMRTDKATTEAQNLINKMGKPQNSKERNERIEEIANIVSSKLGNSPSEALESYIDPSVWQNWIAD